MKMASRKWSTQRTPSAFPWGGRSHSTYQNGEQYSPFAERRRGGLQKNCPLSGGEQLTAAFQLLHALEQWRQSQFGGQIAVHNGTQTEEMGLEAAAATTGGTEAETAEPQAESYSPPPAPELYHESMEPTVAAKDENPQTGGTTATSRQGVWLGLRGTTESQANQLLGSLEQDLDDLVGESTLPTTATLADDDTMVLPGGPYPFPEGGANTLPDGEGGESEPSEPASSEASHRRRRAHAGCH